MARPPTRFEQELEFVQCLANPQYLHFLAENRYFEDAGFIEYLEYMQYWTRPEYAQYIRYPHCLWFLRMILESEALRNALGNKEFVRHVHDQQLFHWQHYLHNVYDERVRVSEANKT